MAEAYTSIEALVAAHYSEVRGLLWALTRNEATADELTQEVFIVALRKGLAPGEGMRLWLRETARRLAMNELRRKRPASLEPVDLGALPAASVTRQETDAETFSEELGALRECLLELPETDRKLLAARYERGTPIAELAEQFGLSAEYVKLKLFRLRKVLAEKIKRKVPDHAERGI